MTQPPVGRRRVKLPARSPITETLSHSKDGRGSGKMTVQGTE
jgi:hypothetical protein